MRIYEDYSTIYGTGETVGNIVGGLLVFMVIMSLVSIAVMVLLLISLYKIFQKNQRVGWHVFIPFLNMWEFLEICGYKGFWCLVPFANMIFMLLAYYKIAIMSGKSTGFGILTALLPYIGLPIIAFSKDKNVVEKNKNNIDNNVINDMNSNINNQDTNTNMNQDIFNDNSSINTPSFNEPVITNNINVVTNSSNEQSTNLDINQNVLNSNESNNVSLSNESSMIDNSNSINSDDNI